MNARMNANVSSQQQKTAMMAHPTNNSSLAKRNFLHPWREDGLEGVYWWAGNQAGGVLGAQSFRSSIITQRDRAPTSKTWALVKYEFEHDFLPKANQIVIAQTRLINSIADVEASAELTQQWKDSANQFLAPFGFHCDFFTLRNSPQHPRGILMLRILSGAALTLPHKAVSYGSVLAEDQRLNFKSDSVSLINTCEW